METLINFRDGYEVTGDDLNNVELFAQASADHIVVDAIQAGRKYTGLAVSQTSANTVTVGNGRLYYDGGRYASTVSGGTPLDLSGLRPNLLNKVVAIVAYPQTVQTDEQQRDYEIDAETQTFEPRAVAMQTARVVTLEAVGGAEAVAPVAPVLDSSVVLVGYVLMSTTGIQTVTMNTDAKLRSLTDVDADVTSLKAFEDTAEGQILTLNTGLAKLADEAQNSADKNLLLQTVSALALVTARVGLPAAYINAAAEIFVNTVGTDATQGDYAARVESGLRFPKIAEQVQAIAPFNPYQTGAVKSPGGLLLPAYTPREVRLTKGTTGDLNIAQYAYENRSLVNLAMSRTRIRFGADFDVTSNSSFFAGGTTTTTGLVTTFQKNGEAFQVYDTGTVDSNGYKILRLSQYWYDSTPQTPYWTLQSATQNLLGYAHVETFLNAQDQWLVALGPHITQKPASGTLTVGICKTKRGQPDFSRIIATTTVDTSNVVLTANGNLTNIPIEPTFLQAGKRYGFFIVSAAEFHIQTTDASQADASGFSGSYFYGLNGGIWNPDPADHLVWRYYAAEFNSPSVDVDLQPLSLVGGVQGVDIMAASVVPGATDLVYSVQIGGVFQKIDPTNPSALASLPPLAPMRATFVGTSAVMPAINMNGSVVDYFRLGLALKWYSQTRNLPASTQKITLNVHLNGFNAANHTIAATILRAGQTTPDTASSIVTTTNPDGTITKTYTFNLPASTTAYKSILAGTTNSPLNTFSVLDLSEVSL